MTELVWEGKYKDGKKVAPVRIALPFQMIETVNESAQDLKVPQKEVEKLQPESLAEVAVLGAN